jgi:hypothetical protein
MSISYRFVVATRLGEDQAQLTPEAFSSNSGTSSGGALVQFEREPWDVPGGFEPTVARQVIDRKFTKKKARAIDLREAADWPCQDQSGNQVVLEFDRRPFHLFVEREPRTANVCEAARTLGGLVAVLAIP